jgi:hypothetical protein
LHILNIRCKGEGRLIAVYEFELFHPVCVALRAVYAPLDEVQLFFAEVLAVPYLYDFGQAFGDGRRLIGGRRLLTRARSRHDGRGGDDRKRLCELSAAAVGDSFFALKIAQLFRPLLYFASAIYRLQPGFVKSRRHKYHNCDSIQSPAA